MKYEITYNISYSKKGVRPFELREMLDEKQQLDDQMYEIRKGVRLFLKDLLSNFEDAPFRVTLYCIAEENYISGNSENELTLRIPKGTTLVEFEDVLINILQELDIKYEIFLSSRQVNTHLIIQLISI